MIRKIVLLIVSFFVITNLTAQTPIVVADMSFKEPSEFYYSFAEGDLIVIDFDMVKGKNVKSFEVIELPNNTKYSTLKPAKFNKEIVVAQKAVYLFRINTGSGKVCNLKISRIPKDKTTEKFSTAWKWKTLYDTTYSYYKEDSLVGFDTIPYVETKKEIAREELREEVLFDHGVEINSSGLISQNNPREVVKISLPQNYNSEYKSEKVIAWVYWLAVGDNSNSIWSKNKNLVSGMTEAVGSLFLSPLAAYALGKIPKLIIPDPQEKNSIIMCLVKEKINSEFAIEDPGTTYSVLTKNRVTGSYEKFINEDRLQGNYYLELYNDKTFGKIRVYVKANAIIKTTYYKDVQIQKYKVEKNYVKVNRIKMNVESTTVRTPVE